MKIAILSNNHPDHLIGGSERAAYAEYKSLSEAGDHDVYFVASTLKPELIGHDGQIGRYQGREREILVRTPKTLFNPLLSENYALTHRTLSAVFSEVQPDLVHFHHFSRFGLEALRIAKEEFGATVHLTLHEFMLICQNLGQMVTPDLKLCHRSSPVACTACFPDMAAGHFFIRKKMIMSYLAHVDAFFAPSHFLADRFVEWGLPADKITVRDNLREAPVEDLAELRNERQKRAPGSKLKLGYFGAATELKGLGVLLDAVEQLPKHVFDNTSVSLYGARIESGSSEFQSRLGEQMQRLASGVKLYGAYDHQDVYRLMASQDWIVVPSIWWENAPLVIDEAKSVGVPVLASNIGGMKERVLAGDSGMHFNVGSPADLADKITEVFEQAPL